MAMDTGVKVNPGLAAHFAKKAKTSGSLSSTEPGSHMDPIHHQIQTAICPIQMTEVGCRRASGAPLISHADGIVDCGVIGGTSNLSSHVRCSRMPIISCAGDHTACINR